MVNDDNMIEDLIAAGFLLLVGYGEGKRVLLNEES
jgi:hypothetical protein